MSATAQTAIYCLLVVIASLCGGIAPMLIRLTHRRMQLALSLVAGLMLGVGLMHMLAHALGMMPPETALQWLMGGFLVMFFIERFFCFHHHDVPPEAPAVQEITPVQSAPAPMVGHDHHGHGHGHDHGHDCGHDHHHGESESAPGDHTLTGGGAAVGLAVHSIINGIALASAVSAEATEHGGVATLAGLAVFLVIALHKPFDALTIVTLATAGGWSRGKKHLVNALFSLCVPAGAMIFILGFGEKMEDSAYFLGAALAFSAGTFMCISMSDLLPELQFHHHDRGKLSLALIAGLLLAWGVALIEHKVHDHGHNPHQVEADSQTHSPQAEPDHHGHNH